MFPMGRAIAGDVRSDLPADQPVGEAVVGFAAGGQAEVRGLVNEQLEISDGEADRGGPERHRGNPAETNERADRSKRQIAAGNIAPDDCVARFQVASERGVGAAGLGIDPGAQAVKVFGIEWRGRDLGLKHRPRPKGVMVNEV